MSEKTWCEVCQIGFAEDTLSDLLIKWDAHIESEHHAHNVIKFMQYDLGALTVGEIPEKLDEYLGNEKQ